LRSRNDCVLTPARQGGDQDSAAPRTRANAPARFETINAKHLQVHEDNLGPEDFSPVHGFTPVGCGLDFMTFELQQHGQ
jgi:hypothetical protein